MTETEIQEAKQLVTSATARGLIKLPVAPCQTTQPMGVVTATPVEQNIEVTAENADEMAQCQTAIVEWCKNKIASMRAEAKELTEAYERAKRSKWKFDTLQRHSELAAKRTEFYERMLVALEHGYQIVPSFPVTAFAIRTDKNKPLKMMTTSWRENHTQLPPNIPAGEGEYKNPFPIVLERTTAVATATTGEKKQYWADSWREMEFPFSMSKPRIMEACTRAMALKIFDDLGILPGYAPSEGTRPPKGDPIIVARLKDPRPPGPYNPPRWVTFIVAWHLNTKEL